MSLNARNTANNPLPKNTFTRNRIRLNMVRNDIGSVCTAVSNADRTLRSNGMFGKFGEDFNEIELARICSTQCICLVTTHRWCRGAVVKHADSQHRVCQFDSSMRHF